MAMALPEQRECVPTSSEENPSLVAPTRMLSARRTTVDVQGADGAEPLSGRIVADGGGSWASMFAHVEEDVDPRSHRAGCCRLRFEVGD